MVKVSRVIASVIVLITMGWVVVMYKPSPVVTPPAKSPQESIQALLPPSWVVESKNNTTPTMWGGDPLCEEIDVSNPTEKYHDPHGFDYIARHTFWFCPEHWSGQPPKYRMGQQVYPAGLLVDAKSFKIFYQSLGNNSQPNLGENVKELFLK